MGHDGAALVLLAQLVGTDPNKEIHLSKREFGLPKLESVPKVEKIVDTICVYSNWTIGWRLIDLVWTVGLAIDGLSYECSDVGVS